MTVVISCVNLKGGVGKTAIAVNFAAYCGKHGYKTLLVDLDPQTNATFSSISPESWSEHKKKKGTVADLLGVRNTDHAEGNDVTASDVILKDVFEGVDLVPSDLSLFTIDLDIGARTAREKLLKKALKEVMDDYDIVVCDCPPNLTLPTQNALAISTHYVVPVSPDFLSSLGIALLIGRVKKFGEDMELEIKNAGIVLSRVGRQSNFRDRTTSDLRKQFSGNILKQEIKERSVVTESTAKNKSVFEMADQAAKKEFSDVSEELLKKVGLKK
ncbi:ParA family protein [Phaeobacter gallaeciensis]|uniref:ParA family protein n=1 Tax=Phaeobacter gallaeciensis TaxID=60890 RepID=UPI00237EFC9C|nr:ParA family protein [Phaeobacter gallaeciensis]MDE4302076.1 ParA family protein [Phaeobacter gallaeciensis]MDE4306947.1 ParA family protein [Phaeobacter gallaeciensis]MDE4310934.1 ParA family protein [Phaeobacter gallaeciensis]MDE4315397.1 ParA family protein [Phaeobacter gallaeciensis]MDE4319861.1 ParA family protein [Phaeobacter gallaeciensis]